MKTDNKGHRPEQLEQNACLISLEGIVQGVGMRPFICRLAREMSISGWVNNTGNGVKIHAEGKERKDLVAFVRRIEQDTPALALITRLHTEPASEQGYRDFTIVASREDSRPNVLISPDVCVCKDCLADIYDPENRRFGYAFTNCTNCGPRYTIIKERPYDRRRTTMTEFALCDDCEAEYNDIGDRRFHAQPVACRRCGPELVFVTPADHLIIDEAHLITDEALAKAQRLLEAGGILALKGLGGYHLACDATNSGAVRRLRSRKERGAKPFAVMAANVEQVKKATFLNDLEETWLTSPAAPIVLLDRRYDEPGPGLAEDLAPGLHTLGVILPYTPLHDLLMHGRFDFLVLTSANLSGQPLIFRDEEALDKLAGLADGFLLHNREIFHPCDDSVVRRIGSCMTFFRRARGYVPLPLAVPPSDPHTAEGAKETLLAVGADMKNAFCFLEKEQAFVSPYLGEMSDKLSFDRFRQEMRSWQALLHVKAHGVIHDAHPDYATTSWAKRQDQPLCPVSHHHAHLVSVMGEHRLTEPVLGLIADGTGYGTDGMIWGCELLWGSARAFERRAHLQYLPLPGGDSGVKHPLRTAFAYFLFLQPGEGWEDMAVWQGLSADERDILRAQVASGIQIQMTSSAGRLFDVMAALLDVCHEVTYEAQGAMEFEDLAWGWEQELRWRGEEKSETEEQRDIGGEPYPLIWKISPHQKGEGKGGEKRTDVLELGAFFTALWHDLEEVPPGENRRSQLAWKCHASLARGWGEYLDQTWPDKRVVLAGGVFQNKLFTEMLEAFLVPRGWTVYRAKDLPPGDGGIAYGQALIGRARLEYSS